MLVSAQVVVSR